MSYCWRTPQCRKLFLAYVVVEGTGTWRIQRSYHGCIAWKQDRLRARSVFTAFSPSPPPNRTGYLSHHPALQFPCLFDFGLVKLALVFDNVQERFGSLHLAYLDVLSIGNLPHFAVGLLFLLCARVDGSPVR
jgi:hypothetical protein